MNQKSAASRRPATRFRPTPRDRDVFAAIRTHGRLTASQVRRLFFRRPDGLASAQTVNVRLRTLVDLGYLEVIVVDRGRGAGPYAYGLTRRAMTFLGKATVSRRRGGLGPVWHQLEISEFRVRLELALEAAGGSLVDWTGEPALRSLLKGQRDWPIPDALVHWRLPGREGAFFLEWDRDTESLATLVAKLPKYEALLRARGHRLLQPGLGLRPRLALVVSPSRRQRLVRHLVGPASRGALTTAVASAGDALGRPLEPVWWRSDSRAERSLFS